MLKRPAIRGKWLLLGGAIILLVTGGAAISLWLRENRPKQEAPKAAAPPVFQGAEVSITGKIQPAKIVPVAAPIDGVLDAWFVDAGQEVYEGQLLGRIKNSGLEAEQERAAAELERAQTKVTNLDGAGIAARLEASRAAADAARARADLDKLEKIFLREQMLMKEGATPRLKFEKAEKDYKAAKSEWEILDTVAKNADEHVRTLSKELDAARVALAEKTDELEEAKSDVAAGEIHSPVDGLVIGVKGVPGGEISRTTTDLVLVAVELTSLQVVLTPEASVFPRIQPGQVCSVHVAEFPEELPGKVAQIKGTEVIVEFVSPSPVIKPGSSAQVRIKLT